MNQMLDNKTLISNEEEYVVKLLRDKYLDYTNHISLPAHPRNSLYTRYGKRILDICISLPACIILLPINILLGIGTFLDVGIPIFYKQTRIGKGGKEFVLIKFRNMNNKTDADGRLLPPAKRVTKYGKIVRKLSLDELLNFWFVLKGDMSIIGPRPLPFFIYERMSNRHKTRVAVRPGLECPRVIRLDYIDTCRYQRTFENDIWYVENVSFFQDVRLLFLLVKMVFSFGKRKEQATGEGVSYFVGYDNEGHAMSMIKYRRILEEKGTV